MNNIDDILKGGFPIDQGHVTEWIVLQLHAITFLTSEVLKRQLELEQIVKEGSVDNDKVASQMKSITDQIADIATARKNSLFADFYMKNKGSV